MAEYFESKEKRERDLMVPPPESPLPLIGVMRVARQPGNQTWGLDVYQAGLKCHISGTVYEACYPDRDHKIVETLLSASVLGGNNKTVSRKYYTERQGLEDAVQKLCQSINPFVLKAGFLPRVYEIKGLPQRLYGDPINLIFTLPGEAKTVKPVTLVSNPDLVGFAVELFWEERFAEESGLTKAMSKGKLLLKMHKRQYANPDLLDRIEMADLHGGKVDLPIPLLPAYYQGIIAEEGEADWIVDQREAMQRSIVEMVSTIDAGFAAQINNLPSLTDLVASIPASILEEIRRAQATYLASGSIASRLKPDLDQSLVFHAFHNKARWCSTDSGPSIGKVIQDYYDEVGRFPGFYLPSHFYIILNRAAFAVNKKDADLEATKRWIAPANADDFYREIDDKKREVIGWMESNEGKLKI